MLTTLPTLFPATPPSLHNFHQVYVKLNCIIRTGSTFDDLASDWGKEASICCRADGKWETGVLSGRGKYGDGE